MENKGFTLIEMLLYMALFSMIIGGGMAATYEIIQATEASTNHTILEEEANFLLRKIHWALTDINAASDIAAPATYSDTTLKITKSAGVLTFNLSGNNLTLAEASGSALPLNSSNVKVSLTPSVHLFQRLAVSGKPDAIIASFTLTAIQNGRNISEDFTLTKYLRQ